MVEKLKSFLSLISQHQVLKPLIGHYVVVSFDNILVYNRNEECLEHMRAVLLVLQKNELHINLKKCSFLTISVLFLGYIISFEGINVDFTKV